MKIIFKNLFLVISSSALLLTACTKANRDDTFPPGDVPPTAGGYTAADQIAPSNLLAYWSFDNNKAEAKSTKTPIIDSNSSFVDGIKGKALNLNKGYLLYPTIAALSSANAVNSVTVSMWVKVQNNGSYFSEFFTLCKDTTKENDWLSILNVGAETGRAINNPNLTFHTWVGSFPTAARKGGDNINDYGNAGSDFKLVPNDNAWVQYVARYDANGETMDFYINNIRTSNNNFRVRGGLGPLIMPTPTQVIIGAFSNNSTHFPSSATLGFHGFLNGSLDEIRVYGKALSDPEISALYTLEKQGR